MTDEERRDLQCDLLVFVATQTEEEQLLEAASELGIAVEQKNSSLGDYYRLGQVGDSLLNAFRVEMGPMSYGGSAFAGILFQNCTFPHSLCFLHKRHFPSLNFSWLGTASWPRSDDQAQ